MNFLDDESNPVENCPKCGASFSLEKGANCPLICPAKQLEMKHESLVPKIISYCLKKETVLFIPPKNTPITDDKWGWTDDVKKIIYIPWYTLRSKKEFFETVIHEIGHITAYKKLFNSLERKIIYIFDTLKLRHKIFRSRLTKIEVLMYYLNNQKVIDKYQKWDGHDPNPWHKEYLKFHKKLINSSFVEYAYGDTEPRSYGFDRQGRGNYDPQK